MAKIKAPTTWYNYTYSYPDGYYEDGVDLSNIVFYVGKGTDNRIVSHEREAARECDCSKCEEIQKIWASGKPVKKRIVFETLVEAESLENEKRLILQHTSKWLTNISFKPRQEEEMLLSESAKTKLRIMRESHYISRKKLAKLAGVHEMSIIRMEECKKTYTSRELADKVLGCLSSLIGQNVTIESLNQQY